MFALFQQTQAFPHNFTRSAAPARFYQRGDELLLGFVNGDVLCLTVCHAMTLWEFREPVDIRHKPFPCQDGGLEYRCIP